jgi:hypothetical protein
MSDALKNGGFASMPEPLYRDMFLRDWFAGQALAGYFAAPNTPHQNAIDCAAYIYEMADAMLAERQAIRPARYLTVAAGEDRG